MNAGDEDFWRRMGIRQQTAVPPVTVPRRMWPPPPEVLISKGAAGWGEPPYGEQIFSRTDDGGFFSRYVECAGGCGWLIGVGDAVDIAIHESCAERGMIDFHMRTESFMSMTAIESVPTPWWARTRHRLATRARNARDALIWRAGYEKRRDDDDDY